MAAEEKRAEYWLSGPVSGVPALLQPVAHALLQASREIHEQLQDFDENLLWEQPAGVASVAFHLQHIPGVLDRLFTYAAGGQLSWQQLKYLSEEGLEDNRIRLSFLLTNLDAQVEKSINYLKRTDGTELTGERLVGRKQVPSTLSGLLFHAAEHSMRHTGQLLVTARILSE